MPTETEQEVAQQAIAIVDACLAQWRRLQSAPLSSFPTYAETVHGLGLGLGVAPRLQAMRCSAANAHWHAARVSLAALPTANSEELRRHVAQQQRRLDDAWRVGWSIS